MLSQERGLNVPVDLIRTVAIVGVIFLHATNDLSPDSMTSLEVYRWLTVDVYQSIARMAVPLFVMLTGALLLQPAKNESLSVFFKKRWARIGWPFLFWGALYFVWVFFTKGEAVTFASVFQGYLSGPYLQFWYIYMLAGLYLITPILRVVIAHASDRTVWYFIVIWFIGASLLPLMKFFTGFDLSADVFTITGWVGYYILGLYLLKVKIPRTLLVAFMVMGVSLAAIGTVWVSWTVGGGTSYFFQEYLSPTMILASAMAFMLLTTIKISPYKTPPKTPTPIANKLPEPLPKQDQPSLTRKLMHVISENTLPIFLFHLIVLEALQKGFLGLTLNGVVLNSIIGVPVTTVVVLFICLAVIVPLKKVPYLKNLIG